MSRTRSTNRNLVATPVAAVALVGLAAPVAGLGLQAIAHRPEVA